MKKIFIAIMLSAVLIAGFTHTSHVKASAEAPVFTAIKDTIIMTLMRPEIQNAVNVFYEPYIDQPLVGVFLPSSKIVDIKAEEGGSTFTVTVEVTPYVGAHNSVGKDRITMFIYVDGNVTVTNYEHIESYELPPHNQSYLKKPLPQ